MAFDTIKKEDIQDKQQNQILGIFKRQYISSRQRVHRTYLYAITRTKQLPCLLTAMHAFKIISRQRLFWKEATHGWQKRFLREIRIFTRLCMDLLHSF